MKTEVLREVWRITERKNGAVFKTEFVEQRWVPTPTEGRPDNNPDLMWVTISDPNVQTIRRVPE